MIWIHKSFHYALANNSAFDINPVLNAAFSQDLASVVAVSGQYVTVEKYVDAKYDLHIFKIGDFYRALM